MKFLLLILFKLVFATCPAKDKCPHYSDTERDQNKPSECPLKTANCPYYSKNKDKKFEDMDLGANFVHDGFTHGKVRECPYYHSEIDENFKSKCPYLRKQANDAEKASENLGKKCDCANCKSGDKQECTCGKGQTSNCDCPLCNSNLKNIRDLEKPYHCPFANSKCPYMDTDHSECPLEKCPYFAKLKKGNIDDMDISKENCPLKDKCPYYQKFKKDPKGNMDCPMHHGNNEKCPHAHSHNVVRTNGIPTENKVQRVVRFSDEKIENDKEPESKEVLEQLQEWERELNEL